MKTGTHFLVAPLWGARYKKKGYKALTPKGVEQLIDAFKKVKLVSYE